MATGEKNLAARSMARIRHLFGVVSPTEISDSRRNLSESIHYGMFMESELRHVDGILNAYDPSKGQRKALTEQDIDSYLVAIASDTRKKIDEIKNLKLLAPEITAAKDLIVSSILSPVDLQTDSVTIQVDHPGLDADTNSKLTEYLTTYFNKQYQLGPKIVEWLGCAGFEEGAKPILVLPKNELDVLNTVADKWEPDRLHEYEEFKKAISASTESLCPRSYSIHEGDKEDGEFVGAAAVVEAYAMAELEKAGVGTKVTAVEGFGPDPKASKPVHEGDDDATLTTKKLAKVLTENSFKLLRTTEKGDAVIVTRDMRSFGKPERNRREVIDRLQREAERQIRGFKADEASDTNRPTYPVLSISDVARVGHNDLPIVIEFPCDSVIPVCAPNDNKNHIGYYIILDENGQPCRGKYAFNSGVTADVNNRLATNAAKAVYGNSAISAYTQAGLTNAQALDQMTQVFACAVNQLLRDKLNKDGLTGLDIHVHEAVGKSLFFNLLAKNRIKMIFVPAPMLIYYRFLHRDDGTGKTFLEDIAYLLALRCTLTIAKVMAAVDNATQHRRIEVNVDEKNANVLETLELARHAYLSKKAPQFTTDPTTAAESILSQHLSLVPKGLIGNTDELNVTTEKSYGNSQAPDADLMENLNNWIGQGMHIPPSALNQLKETEYAKSVATSNLFFSNYIRAQQTIIRPFNKKFVMNYILANDQMLDDMRAIILAAKKGGSKSSTKVDDLPSEPDHPSEHESVDPNKDEKTEESLKRVISTVEVVLPPPNMSTSKAHFEEVQAQTEAVSKILDTIYPDDVAPNDELRSLMASIRAIMASQVMREFLPKLGFHNIASVPALDEVDDNMAVKAILRLGEIKKRVDQMAALHAGKLSDQNNPSPGDSSFSSGTPGEGGGGGEFGSESGDENPEGGGEGGEGDFGIPSFKV